jgi:hypothetical protein
MAADDRAAVGDAVMTTVTIKVTAEDIAAGEKFDCFRCPVALAATRVLPVGTALRVKTHALVFWNPDYREANLPAIARYFIEDFDNGEDFVAPFSFNLDVPL